MKLRKIGILAAVGLTLAITAIGLSSEPVQAQFRWAKIADWGVVIYYWRSGRGTAVWGYANKKDALAAARAKARRKGFTGRHRWFYVRNRCMFIYKDVDSTLYAWGKNRNKNRARNIARDRCQRGGRNCRRAVWVCTRR